MATTIRTKKPHTISKGRQRRNIRHNSNERFNEPTTIHKRNKGRKGGGGSLSEYDTDALKVAEAERLTLKYYFDEEWFDERGDLNYNLSEGQRVRWEGTPNTPFRCKHCKEAFHRHHNRRKKGIHQKLPQSVFNTVLLISGECEDCQK